MPTAYEKRAFAKWAGKDGQGKSWGAWRAPETPYPIGTSEAEQLKSIIETLQALPRYSELEAEAKATDTLVTTPLFQMANASAFLENTAHQTVSVATKGGYDAYPAQNWRLRVGTLPNLYQRLLDGYSVSYALCDRYGQYIRRGSLWYAADGIIIDCDEFRTPEKPDRPEPVYSRDALFEQHPQLPEYASFLMPSTRSLLEGKPFKGRAVIPFPETVTDKRLFHAIGDYLYKFFGFLPKNVTKNPIAVAFGARHQARHAWQGDGIFPSDVLQRIKQQVIDEEKQRKRDAKKKEQVRQQREQERLRDAELREELKARGIKVSGSEMREPISTFIETVDSVAEMQKLGWITHNHGDEYHWVGGSVGRSCEIVDGRIKIFSGTMAAASPDTANEPVNAHRFLLYNLYELDITKDSDKHELRCLLADAGYGTHPDAYRAAKAAEREAAIREGLISPEGRRDRRSSLSITGDFHETLVALEDNEQALAHAFTQALQAPDADIPHYHILHFEMGSGKNHALLTSLKALDKRGIGIFENHEQVDEQVSKAFNEFGLIAMGFRGRGYKFKESGLSGIPVKMRQMDADLFDKFPGGVCGFYDSIKKWESKGLGAYEYCLDCPFLKSCPYLSQFKSVSDVDFLGICMHDLFFDPGLEAFLKRIWHRGEETEEAQMIGDALGIESGLRSMAFDIGVLDEVVARNLYLSYEYALEDFQALACSWNGEALGDFMTEILRCFRDKGSTDRLAEIKVYLQTLDEGTREQIHEQMTQIPKSVTVHQHTQRDKDTSAVLSEYFVRDDAENEWRIPVSADAESILRKKKIATLRYQNRLPKGKIGISPYGELRSGRLTLRDIKGRLWSKEWTLLHQLETAVKTDVQWIGTKYNLKGEQVCCDTVTLTIPPQANTIIKRLVLMGGTMDVENIQRAFAGQAVGFSVSGGKAAAYAPGVETFQLTDRRLTFQSVFELEKDAEGKTVYEDETNAPAVIGLTPSATKDLEQICRLAERHIAAGNPLPVFISYKDFTESPIVDLPIVQRMHGCLQVKHFDLTRGLNFQGVKVFIIYGYPKSARPDVVQKTAEILYHAETEPLDFTYERCDEEEEGYKAMNIGKFRDARLESVRQQLTRDKSKQALYRSRPTRWAGTITLHFSAEPIPGWTERATGFTRTDFQRAENFEALGEVVATREHAEAEGDVQTLVAGAGVSKSTAYRNTEPKRKQDKAAKKQQALALYADGLSFGEISAYFGGKPSERTIRRWVEDADF